MHERHYTQLLVIFLFSNIHNIHCESTPWSNIGTGVFYRSNNVSTENESNVIISYSGWKVNEIQSQTWSNRLLSKSMLKNEFYKMNHQYCVIGPKDSQYTSLEIQNSKLVTHLYELYKTMGTKLKLIVIVAHSSGSFVADEFFQQFYNKINQAINSGNEEIMRIGLKLAQKIVFYNLDGAITPSNKNKAYLERLFSKIYFVWAVKRFDATYILRSMNYNSMSSGSGNYPQNMSEPIEIVSIKDTCINSKCLHDVLITEIPYDVANFNTDKDYTSFSDDNEVQFDYLTQSVSLLREMLNK